MEMDNYCPLCLEKRSVWFSATILKKYKVHYYYCKNCGMLQTENPYWLKEAYNNVIALSDTGLVSRNISMKKTLSILLYLYFDKNGD